MNTVSPRTLTSFAVAAAGGGQFIFNLPNDYSIVRLGLRVSGAITIGTANATALQAGGCANVIRNVRLVPKGEIRHDLRGYEMKIVNQLFNEDSIVAAEPALVQAANDFECIVYRDFFMPRLIQAFADRGQLPAHLIRDVQVVVDIGLPEDVVVKDTGTTAVFTGVTIEPFIVQAVPSVTAPAYFVNEKMTAIRDTEDMTATGRKRIKLPTGNVFRGIILVTKTVTTGTVNDVVAFDDTLIDDVRLLSNNTEIIGSAGTNYRALKGDNRAGCFLTGEIAGVVFLDFGRGFSPAEMLDTTPEVWGNSDLQLEIDVSSVGAGAELSILTLELTKPLTSPAQ